MRITISHDKGLQEAMRIVDESAAEFFKGMPMGPIEIVDQHKSWSGTTMRFSFVAKMGFLKSPMSGTAEVTAKDITLDFELPGILKNVLPEEKVRTAVQGRVAGLLK